MIRRIHVCGNIYLLVNNSVLFHYVLVVIHIFFLIEPDTRPIRSYWLDAIVGQITNGHNRESYISTKW